MTALVGGGAVAWFKRSATSNLARAVAGALLVTICVAVDTAMYHAQRRKQPTWTVRSYLKTGFPWGTFMLAYLGYALVIDPSSFAGALP